MEITAINAPGHDVTSTTNWPQSRVLVLPRGADEAQSGLWDVSRVLLLSLLFAAPLSFGAVEPWAWGGLVVGAALLLLLWGIGCLRTRNVRLALSPLYIPLLGVLVLSGIQLWFGLSMDRIGTREAMVKLIGYATIFFVTQQLYASTTARAWQLTGAAVAVYMFLMAVFAIVQFFASPGLLYGYRVESNSVFGSYVNHGNYAGLMEMLVPVVMALALSFRRRHPAKPLLLFLVFVAIVSVFLSGSRAGIVSLAVEFAIVALVIAFSSAGQKHLLLIGIVAVSLAFGFFYWLDPGDVWARWEQMASKPGVAFGKRQPMVLDSLRMARDHIGSGVGLGAFQTAYTPYQTVVTDLTVDYAHNDYLQFATETGILGWILVPISIAMFLFLAFRDLRSRLRHQSGWLQLGAAIGVCGILVHSFSDFNLHIPANAAWFAVCAGIAVVPVNTRVSVNDSRTLPYEAQSH